MIQEKTLRRATVIEGVMTILAAVVMFIPFTNAAADSTPAPSSSAAAPVPTALSAALFTETTKAPSDQAWAAAPDLTGIRMGNEALHHRCAVRRVAEWVRIQCGNLSTTRADLVAGEKRDLTFFQTGESSAWLKEAHIGAQFSMRPGDRRLIQFISPDLWWSVWQGDEGKMASGIVTVGAMFGIMVQVDWSGPEPVIAIY